MQHYDILVSQKKLSTSYKGTFTGSSEHRITDTVMLTDLGTWTILCTNTCRRAQRELVDGITSITPVLGVGVRAGL